MKAQMSMLLCAGLTLSWQIAGSPLGHDHGHDHPTNFPGNPYRTIQSATTEPVMPGVYPGRSHPTTKPDALNVYGYGTPDIGPSPVMSIPSQTLTSPGQTITVTAFEVATSSSSSGGAVQSPILILARGYHQGGKTWNATLPASSTGSKLNDTSTASLTMSPATKSTSTTSYHANKHSVFRPRLLQHLSY